MNDSLLSLIAHPFSLILAACVLDGLFGDPVYPLHPIRLLGAWSLAWERRLFAMGLDGHWGGALHWLLVAGGALAVWWSMHQALYLLHPGAAWLWDVFWAYSLLCMRDLLAHGARVRDSLEDLPRARKEVAMLVGRDTGNLPRDGITRAAIESLSENLTDGVLTPLWALCLFGLPGLVLVKATSSLDSMVGYKNTRYRRFGRTAARLDDLIHWLPARLSVPLIMLAAALLGLHPVQAWKGARRYHGMLTSPNSGWSEAAFAGALKVRLLGPIRYGGELAGEAFLGEPDWPSDLGATDLHRALRLVATCCLLAIAVGLVLAGI
uniref:Cobalamin biosynthesis protein CobD n=1 Tax=Candidatus Kentrum sp. DK TaxID=2126562 RepID=A0A450S0L7_9GAMM|nr:MAG: adenosylcobinamide-phosphate synthase [Candidatus Kentron sp. DK]